MDFLVIRVQQRRPSRAQRPLGLFRCRIEGDLFVGVLGLRVHLVDVLSANGHKRCVRRRVHLRVLGTQLRDGRREV